MPVYYVGIREVHVSTRQVIAASPEEAMELAGDSEEVMCEYSHTLDKETWSVERDPGAYVIVTSSPFEEDEPPPWLYRTDSFRLWVHEVLILGGDKRDDIPVPGLEEAMSIARERGYGIEHQERRP